MNRKHALLHLQTKQPWDRGRGGPSPSDFVYGDDHFHHVNGLEIRGYSAHSSKGIHAHQRQSREHGGCNGFNKESRQPKSTSNNLLAASSALYSRTDEWSLDSRLEPSLSRTGSPEYQNLSSCQVQTKITINVSGERFQTFSSTLERFPSTLLGDREKRNKFYDETDNEYFFDRERTAFGAILYYYQSGGQLYCPLTVPMHVLVAEATFFELGNEALQQVLDLDESSENELPKNKLQREIWKLFEYPESSKAANIITLISVIVILLSVAILCAETLPYFKPNTRAQNTINTYSPKNIQSNSKHESLQMPEAIPDSMPEFKPQKLPAMSLDTFINVTEIPPKDDNKTHNETKKIDWIKIFDTCEIGFVAWFTLEFVVRFLSSPDKLKFSKSFMNIIDLLAILPYYVTVALDQQGPGFANFRIIRLVRVFRIFKLSRHSRGLQILGLTLRASMQELGLLIFFLAIGVILFSSAVYYVESKQFESIPDAFWWALITMCTVGYGDKVPETFWGKIIGSACAVSGVLTIALPVPVIVSNFDYFYNRERTRNIHHDVMNNAKIPAVKSTPASPAHSYKSPKSSRRNELIQRQSLLRKLEQSSRKLNHRLSKATFKSSSNRRIAEESMAETEMMPERESVV